VCITQIYISRIVALTSGGRRPPQVERSVRRMGRRVFFAVPSARRRLGEPNLRQNRQTRMVG